MRILIVEDEALVALELEGMLLLGGHEPVGTADDVASAVLAATAARPDLALVDVQLAMGASGLDVAAALGRMGVPVLFATGNCPEGRGQRLALGCLHKPYSDADLAFALASVQALLAGRPGPGGLPGAFHAY